MDKESFEKVVNNLSLAISKVFNKEVQLKYSLLNEYAFSSSSMNILGREIEFTITDTSPDSAGPFSGLYNWNIEIGFIIKNMILTLKRKRIQDKLLKI